MEPLKEMFNKAYFEKLAKEIKKKEPGFSSDLFLKEVNRGLDELSLNQRMRQTSNTLKKHLPQDFDRAIEILKKTIPQMQGGYTNLVFPDFVGQFGQDHFEISMDALKYFTTFGSSEFAIREFLIRDFGKTITVMSHWASDKNEHVRRLSSEGCRPRLPWSFKLDEVIKNPKLTTRILNQLKTDESAYVRKSVANHLNDISKEHPDYMLEIIKAWDKNNKHSAWIMKHASRTLVKKGNKSSLGFFNFEKNPKLKLSDFKIGDRKIKLGKSLSFSFQIDSEKNKKQKLVIDYIIHYVKQSGGLSPKVFKLKELDLEAGQKLKIGKNQIIKDFTTRKHHPGKHKIQIQINGLILAETSFMLIG